MKIGVQFSSKNGRETEYKNFANLKWRPVAILKNVFGDIPKRNFIGRSRITVRHRSRDQYTKFHNSRWRTAAFESGFIAVCHAGIIRFQLNLVGGRKFWFHGYPRAGSRAVGIDPLRFLAGCRKRRLNQVVCLKS